MHCKEQRRIISEIYMFIFQSKFNNPPYRDRITEKSGTLKNKNSALDLRRQCTSVCEQSICKVQIYRNEIRLHQNYTM